MSRRKRQMSTGPAVIGVPSVRDPASPKPDALEASRELWRAQGRKEAAAAIDAAIDQVRADAQALETAAKLLRDAPGYPVPHTSETIEALLAMATGMRLAADRMQDSRDIPF